MTGALHQLSQGVYSRTQAAGGLRLFRLKAIMLEYRAGLHRFATQAHSLFADIKRDAKQVNSLRREVELLLRPGCLRRSRCAAVRGKKNSGIVSFVSCRDRRSGHTKDTEILAACEQS